MGIAPPPALPPPSADDPGFAVEPGDVSSLCKFKLPFLRFKGFFPKIPSISFPPAIPFPKLAFGISCDSNNPVNVSAGIPYGGGRTPNALPSPDTGPGS